MHSVQILAAVLLVATPFVSAHGLISSVTGNLGGNGTGFGVAAGGEQNEGDVTVFRSSAGAFGATGAGGNVVPATDLAAMIKITGATIPQVSTTGGVVTMVYHQLNADGAGPVSCSVSADASGKTFTAMKITSPLVPGTNGRSNAANADFPLVASMPAGTVCTGTVGTAKNVCLVKCANPVGPFGSVVPVQMSAGTAASSSSSGTKSSGGNAGSGTKSSSTGSGAKVVGGGACLPVYKKK